VSEKVTAQGPEQVSAGQSEETRRQRADRMRDEHAAALFRQAATCPKDSKSRIHQQIVIDYLDVATSIARRYSGGRQDWSDLRQVACLGLVKAVKGFDLGKGDDFVAYCAPTISGEVKRYLRDHGWFVRPPRSVQELRGRIGEAEPRMMQELGRAPSARELAADLGEELDKVDEALRSHESLRPSSLDAVSDVTEDAQPLGELLGHLDARLERAEVLATIAPACRRLSARERRIVYLRFFEERTQAQIGQELDVTQMQVSRLIAQILERLRTELVRESTRRTPRAGAVARSAAVGSRQARVRPAA
jgi:RNA polymerase sigma-B factor